jgi:S-formylglutathione hydrolase FrmB
MTRTALPLLNEDERMPFVSIAWSRRSIAAVALVLAVRPASAADARPLAFHLTFDRAVSAEPFTGRVYVMLSRNDIKQVPTRVNWFRPEPFFARDVKDWRPGQVLVVEDDALGFPQPLAKLSKGTYFVQAIMDFDRGHNSFSAGPGNGYSRPQRCDLDPAATGLVALHLDQVYHPRAFVETERVKLVEIESRLLTAFHGRPTRLRAGVVLPPSFAANPGRRYPVVYEVPGFGGDHFMAFRALERKATDLPGVEVLHVVLDPGCRLGHHVFADSANNGPCGRALIEELIPAVESRYRGLGTGRSRLVTGHSSGGWSSLWLQVVYPDHFAGVWSTSPDPVDFRDFQKIDLTRPSVNMFIDDRGNKRPIARRGGEPVLWYKPFSDMEEVMGHGGQLASFEAVFSPRGPDGRPRRLWDRTTGDVDAEVARAWQRYDIRRLLEANWPALAPKLAGKLHVYTGGNDTFYLEGAVALLRDSLQKLGSDAVVEVVAGRDHGSLLNAPMRERIAREMAGCLRRAQAPAE